MIIRNQAVADDQVVRQHAADRLVKSYADSLFGDFELRESLGRRAKERVNQLFTKARMVDQVRAIYRGVLSSGSLPEIVTAA